MTVPSTTRRAGPFTGNGVTTSFPFSFKVFGAADIALSIANASGIAQSAVLNQDYLVTLNADQTVSPGGSVQYAVAGVATALPAGYTLAITGSRALAQTVTLPTGGAYQASVVEAALDSLEMQIQQVDEATARSLTLSPLAPVSTDTMLPLPAANKLISWNETATGLQNADPGTLATIVAFGTANADQFTGTGAQTAFTLSANPGALNNLDVSVGGVTQRPGVDYTWISGTTLTFTAAPASGVPILVRYMQGLPQGYTDASLVGFDGSLNYAAATLGAVVGDEVHASAYPWLVGPSRTAAQNTAGLQACVNFANGRKIVLPAGDIPLNAGTIKAAGTATRLHLTGQGRRVTRFVIDAGSSGFVFEPNNSITVEDFAIIQPTGADGVHAIGSDTSSLAIFSIREIEIVGGETGIKYTGSGGWPLGGIIDGIYLTGQTWGGIIVDNSLGIGQGIYTLRNVIHVGTTSGTPAVAVASSLSVTRDATSTTDTMTWAATGQRSTGWHVMRKPQGSTDGTTWQHVAYVNSGTLNYTANKTAGLQYDYFVCRRTVGVRMVGLERVSIDGCFGYSSDGLNLISCRAVTVATYGEWRFQVLNSPAPRGYGIFSQSNGGLHISDIWSDGHHAGALIRDTTGSCSAGRIDNAQLAAFHLQQTARAPFLIEPVTLAAGTSALVYEDPAFTAPSYIAALPDAAAMVLHINDVTESRIQQAWRGTVNAKMRTDSTGGHFESTGGHTTWTPSAAAGLTTTGAITLTGTATWRGSYWEWTLRITATTGTHSCTAGTQVTGLASLTPAPIAGGANSLEAFSVVNLTATSDVGSGWVGAGIIRLPAWSALTDVFISGRCKV